MDAEERRRLMEAGRAAFNRGEFYEAHEFWEEVWDQLDDPDRTWVQGLIQVATGLHKLGRDRPDICRRLLDRALAKLQNAPVTLEGFDLEELRADAKRVLSAVERGDRPAAVSVRLWRKT